MKQILFSIFLLFYTASGFGLTIQFNDQKKGESPKGWDQGFYGIKGSPVWKIDEDPTAPSKSLILKQTGQAVYSWLVQKNLSFQNGTVEADLKVVSGKEDPEVGLIWRHQDSKNYNYVRINAMEENIIFYRMNQGRKEVVKEAETKVGFNNWHHLTVRFKDDQIEIFFDKKPVISVRDSVLKKAGRAGLFTTADTVGSFDNITLTPNNP